MLRLAERLRADISTSVADIRLRAAVSFWFYQRGWSGIVVEPQPALAALHRRLRPRDTLVEAVIGRSSGETDFFKIDRLHGLSTTIRSNAEAAGVHGVGFETMKLPSISLARPLSHTRDR